MGYQRLNNSSRKKASVTQPLLSLLNIFNRVGGVFSPEKKEHHDLTRFYGLSAPQ
jgi:hypothetical protein